jgi:hypothetical protein
MRNPRVASHDLSSMVMPMASPVRTQPEIADIIALARALDRDEQRAPGDAGPSEKKRLQELASGEGDRVTVALSWLEAVENDDEAVRSIHQRAETAIHLTGFLIGVAAVLLGWGATLAAFYFDGSGRVNVVSVLALLVALPALMIMPFIIAALPLSIIRNIPGALVGAALSRAISPGRLAPMFWRVFPRDLREAVALVAGRTASHQRLYSSLQKWAILRWSQLFAAIFQITALVACLVLVVFTDLAFGWSTTLTTGNAALDGQRVHRITSVIAAPWSWVFDDALPSLELIEQSRYYRVASGSVTRAEAARLGSWWQFVAMTIAVYGLLPRIITLAIASARLRTAVRAAIIAAPGLSVVLRRIHRAQIETRAVQPEAIDENTVPGTRGDGTAARGSGDVRAVINWSDVPLDTAQISTAFPAAQIFAAGGAAAVQDDVVLARKVGETRGGDVLIVVKAWEPPLMEFIDFLNTLREAQAGAAAMLFVLPVGLDHSSKLGAALPSQLKVWRDKLATIGDPWLRVAASVEEVRP